MIKTLKEIGLTESETKVYVALLKLGESPKGPILKETKTAPSKIYHVLEKLIDKGLVSYFVKNKVKHFRAAPPERVGDYLEKKKKELESQEKDFLEVLPQLKKIKDSEKSQVTSEIYYGWKGLETVHNDICETLKKGQTDYVFGASRGENPEKTKDFFLRHCLKKKKRGIKIQVIFNEASREYAESMNREGKIGLIKRFIEIVTPVEVNIYGDKTAIIRLKKDPIVFLIHDEETSDSFKKYFDAMWNIAEN